MITDLPTNNFKRGLEAGTPQIGLWMSLASPVATEIVAGAGFDWMLIDCEHSPNDLSNPSVSLQPVDLLASAIPLTPCSQSSSTGG